MLPFVIQLKCFANMAGNNH